MEINSKYFYEELKKMMENENDQDEGDVCKITLTPLLEDFVTLECGHKFNYDAIFNEIYQQKCVFMTYTFISAIHQIEKKFSNPKDCTYFIRCPYCRNIQFSLIPPKEGCKSVYGINSNELTNDDVPFLLNTPPGVWIYKKLLYKCHGKQCDFGLSCVYSKIGEKTTHFHKIDKYYCMNHAWHGIVATKEFEKQARTAQKKAEAEAKIKAKEETKKAKLEAKEQAKKAKLEAKEQAKKAKEEAKKAKEEAKKAKQEAKKSA
jgi:hypothetical protein